MAWFKVDDMLAFHVKVIEAGNAAMGLWVRAGSWCAQQLTDGFVPANMVRTFGGSDADADALCDAELWHEVDGGYRFHDWGEYQPTKAQVLEERAKARKRMADLRARSGEQGANTSSTSGEVRRPRSRPQSSSRTSSTARRKPEIPLPDSWEPNEKHQEIAKEVGVDIRFAVVRFRDHAATHDRRARDWDAAFRSWLRKAPEYDRGGQVHQIPRRPEKPSVALLPKCPTCNAPQEIVHYEACPDKAWRPTA